MSLLRRAARLFPVLLTGMAAGCGSPPAKTSQVFEHAVAYNHQGQQFFQDKDYKNALVAYGKALQVDRSIENTDGIALNLLNIAQTDVALGRLEAAQASLDEILGNAEGLFLPGQLAQAAIQKSLIFVRQEQAGAAGEWISKADAWCGDSCSRKGLILNLQARFALDRRQPDAAIDLAGRALSLHRKMNLASEAANSLRLLGESHLEKQLPDKAIPLLQEALQLDKELGLPAKISADLLLLGSVHQNAPAQSAVFFKRALAVSQAAGDTEGAQRAAKALASVPCDGEGRPCN